MSFLKQIPFKFLLLDRSILYTELSSGHVFTEFQVVSFKEAQNDSVKGTTCYLIYFQSSKESFP